MMIQNEVKNQCAKASIFLSLFITKKAVSFNFIIKLQETMKSMFPDSCVIDHKLQIIFPKNQPLLNNLIKPAMKSEIVDLMRINHFSLYMDERTDVSSMKVLCNDDQDI